VIVVVLVLLVLLVCVLFARLRVIVDILIIFATIYKLDCYTHTLHTHTSYTHFIHTLHTHTDTYTQLQGFVFKRKLGLN
jgi:hypothetical protein